MVFIYCQSFSWGTHVHLIFIPLFPDCRLHSPLLFLLVLVSLSFYLILFPDVPDISQTIKNTASAQAINRIREMPSVFDGVKRVLPQQNL